MGRAHSTFRQRDVIAAIRAAKRAGQNVTSFEISPNGNIRIHIGESADISHPTETKETDSWDDVRKQE
jgi:hypothetical protein